MLATVEDLAPCHNYSLKIGAGPYIYREQRGMSPTKTSYRDKDQEEFLAQAINKVWAAEEEPFMAFASTLPVSDISQSDN